MSGPAEVYASKKAENLRRLYTDAAHAAAAARSAGRSVFVYGVAPQSPTLRLLVPAIANADEAEIAAIIEGVESQGWRLEHLAVFESRRLLCVFRRSA